MNGSFSRCVLFEDRVVLVRLAEGIRLDATTGRRGIPELETVIVPGPYVAVVDGRSIGYVPPDGRDAVRSSIGTNRVATGLIVKPGASQTLAHRFLDEAEPQTGAVFTSEEDALAWANRRMAETDATSSD